MLEAARLKAVVVAETGTAQRDLDRFGGRLRGGLRGAASAAGAALSGLGAVGGVAMVAGIEAASTFQDELATIQTVARLPQEGIEAIGDEIQELARTSGKSTTDLTSAFYDMVSAGVPAADAMGVLRSSSNLAIGGLGSMAETADLVTSAMNAYGLGADDAGRITDVFAAAVEKGKVTAAELGGSLSNIAPIASSAGVSMEEVAAGYATLTSKGTPAAQAATQMRAAISSLLTPNEALNRIQEQTGINFAELAREKGLATALETLRQATDDNATALDSLAGVTAEEFPAALKAAQDELGLTNSEVEKFTAMAGRDGAAAAMNDLTKQVGAGDSAFAKSLGSIDAYQASLNLTGEASEGFQQTTQEMFDSAGTAAEQAAIKMDSPVEAANRLTQSFVTFMQDVGGPFAQQFGPVVMMLSQTGGLMGGLITPAKLLGGALGGLAGKFVGLAATAVPAIISIAAPFAVPIAIIAAVVAAVVGLWMAWQNNFLGIRDIAASVWEAISGIIGGAVEFIGGVIGGFIDFLGTIWSGISGAASAAWDGVTGVISGAVSGITGIIGGIVDVARGVWETVSGIFGAIGDAAASVGNFITDPVGSVGGFLGGLIPSFDVGAWNIPDDTLAMVHKGEMILPAEVAESLRSILRHGGGSGSAATPVTAQIEGQGAGTVVYQTNLYRAEMQGILPVRRVSDVARGLRVLGESGRLVSRSVQERAAADA